MQYPDPNFVYGYAQLAKLLGTTAGALNVRKHRGRFTLKPVFHIGRTAVFDRDQALVYLKLSKLESNLPLKAKS